MGSAFDAILDGQTDANNPETEEVSDPNAASDRSTLAAVAAPTTAQNALEPLPGRPTTSGSGSRRSPNGKDALNKDAAAPSAVAKDQPASDTASPLFLTAHDVLVRSESCPAPTDDQHQTSTTSQADPAVDAQLARSLLAALADADAAAAGSATAAPAESGTLITDLLIKESLQDAQADQARLADAAFSRPTAIPGSLADAIRLAISQGSFADQDREFNQSASPEFDRRNTKTAPVSPTQLPEAAASLDSAVKALAPSSAGPAVSLPNESGNVSSIVQAMRLQMRDGVGTAVVHLEPDYLGSVSIALRVENGVVTASFHAENPQVRAWMEANAPMLRESLAGQGLSLDHLLVTGERIADEQSSGRRQQQEQEQQARQRPRRDDATTFEVVV
jgi:flagellar hook-length control protein FliK